MHLAVAKLDTKSIIKLIMHGADANVKDKNTGDTPLHLLMNVYTRNVIATRKILGFLIDAGAKVNALNNE